MMKHYLRWACLSSLVFLLSYPLYAQIPTDAASDFRSAVPEMGIFARFMSPIQSLADQGYRQGFGFGMEIFTRPLREESPINLQFGVNLNYDFAGREGFDVWLDYPYPTDATRYISNHQTGGHAVARLITSQRFPIQAYVQGMLGTRWFLTQETIALGLDDDIHDEYCPEAERISSQLVLSYGVGTGLRIRVNDGVWLDMRGSYLTGSGGQFADLGTARLAEDNVLAYSLAAAPRTEQWSASLGITFQLRADDIEDESCGGGFLLPLLLSGSCQ